VVGAVDGADGVDDASASYDSDDKDVRDNNDAHGHNGRGDDAGAALVVRVDDVLRAAAVRADVEALAAWAARLPQLKTKAIP